MFNTMQCIRAPLTSNFVLVRYVLKHVCVRKIPNMLFLCTSVSPTIRRVQLEEQLREIFKFRNTNISNWIIESKAKTFCYMYMESEKEQKQQLLHTLASRYAAQHDEIYENAKKILSIDVTKQDNEKRLVARERNLRNALIHPYYWLFIIIGRLENGVKFLVDLRTDVLDLLSETSIEDNMVVMQQLNVTLRDLFLLWFSVGFLQLERITWQSSCDILQKIADYEAIHPIRSWLDLKKRVGPYRRCYIFIHQSMPREPLVVLHIALCDIIPATVRGIEEAHNRIIGNEKPKFTLQKEDKSKIKSAIFYSIASTQQGLKGIELGYYIIKEVVVKIVEEFEEIQRFSSLSPVPNFRLWLLEKVNQDQSSIFTTEEVKIIQNVLKTENITVALRELFNTSLWTKEKELTEIFKEPLLRACAWYLCKEKRRKYALNHVANFHLRNGAVIWRINWMADPTPHGAANSCTIMVNYRYYLNETELNSQNYIENYNIKASQTVLDLVMRAERLRLLRKY